MKIIKVLHISETFAAGVYTYLKDLCNHCESIEDIENYIIYSGNRLDTNKNKFKQDYSPNTKLIEVSMEREISPFKDFKAIFHLVKEITKIQPDIIHLHSSKAGVLGRIASIFFPKIKVYYTPHGYSFVREDISSSKKKFYWNIEKYMTKIFGGTTIACGDTEFTYAKGIGNAKLIRNGIRYNEISKYQSSEPRNGKIIIGTLGRITPARNPELFNRIATNNPHLEFLWIGDGELKKQLQSDNIEVTGWMDHKLGLKKLSLVDIYIQTSLWEGLPLAVIEAMALKKPILATNIIGNKDAVSHNNSGFLFDTIEEADNYINKLSSEEELRQKFGENGYDRCKQFFDMTKNFNKLIEIYKN